MIFQLSYKKRASKNDGQRRGMEERKNREKTPLNEQLKNNLMFVHCLFQFETSKLICSFVKKIKNNSF